MRPYEVIELLSFGVGISHGTFDTLEDAQGCVRFDRLTEYEIWYDGRIVEECSQ